MARFLILALLGFLSTTSLVAVASAAECPEDPLACVQSVNSKILARKAEETDHLVLEDNDDNVPPAATDILLAAPLPLVPPMPETDNEATPAKLAPAKEPSNETYCVTESPKSSVDSNKTEADAAELLSTPDEPKKPCKKCTVCPRKAMVVRECNATHDTVCVCDKGDFFSALTYECKPCMPCPHGWGVWRQCTRNRNTVCRKCPPGTYSGVISGTLGCILCTSCLEDQVMLQECSRIQDTVCIDKSIGQKKHFQTSSVSSSRDTDSKKVAHANYYSETSILLYCCFAGLVILIFGLVLYVLLECRHKRTKTPPAPLTGHVFLKSPMRPQAFAVSPLAAYTPLATTGGHLYRQQSVRSSSLERSQKQRSSGIYSSRRETQNSTTYKLPKSLNSALKRSCSSATAPSTAPSTKVVRYCDLSSTKKRALEASLNSSRPDARDWKGLARQFGYTDIQVVEFEVSGREKYGATKHLLADWSKRDSGATVADLVAALLRIGRIDSAFIVDATCLRRHPVLPPGLMV